MHILSSLQFQKSLSRIKRLAFDFGSSNLAGSQVNSRKKLSCDNCQRNFETADVLTSDILIAFDYSLDREFHEKDGHFSSFTCKFMAIV